MHTTTYHITGLFAILLAILLGCGPAGKKENTDLTPWLQQGDSLRDLSQKTLMKALVGAGADSVPEQAVAFCHEEAAGLLSAIGEKENIQVQRLAERYRNPKNALRSEDFPIWEKWKSQLSQGQSIHPEVVEEQGGMMVYRAPLFLGMPLCEKCHGDENNFSAALRQTLAQLYPEDQALHFRQGDLRAMWKITFLPLSVQ